MVDFPLDDRYELELDGTWTDVTGFVYERDPVTITRGRSAEAQTADPSKLSLTLDNRDGRFSPRNPLSPYFGVLGRNTPIRVSLPYGSSYLRVRPGDGDSHATCPDSAGLDVTGDLDIRIEVDADHWEAGDLAAKYETTGDQRSWWVGVVDGCPEISWSPDGTFASRIITDFDTPLPVERGHLALRATLDVDNGAGGWTVRFYTADALAGPWSQLGPSWVGSGTTSVFASTASVEVGAVDGISGDAVPGRYLGFELYDGIGGTAVASPDFSSQSAGTTSFADAQGNTWTIDGAEIDDRRYRFHGEVASWPATWAVDGVDRYVKVAASGITRRLGQNAPSIGSPMRREFANPARTGIVAYWPLEDGDEATRVASAIAGAEPAQVTGSPDLGGYSGWTASEPIPVMGTGRIQGAVPHHTSTGEISIRLFVFFPSGSVPAETSLLKVKTTGTAALWEIRVTTTGGLRTKAWDNDGAAIDDGPFVDFENGALDGEFTDALGGQGFTILDLELSDNGSGGVDWRTLVIDFNNADTIDDAFPQLFFSGTISGYSVGTVTSVVVGDEQGLNDLIVGHLTVANDLEAYASSHGGITAHNGETPNDRLVRLCDEEQIPVSILGRGVPDDDRFTMGDQLSKPLLELLAEAEATDGGTLFEPRDELGLAFRPRVTLYNQPAVVTLDHSAGQVAGALTPVDDDRSTVNDVTVKRVAGSGVRFERSEGPLSVQQPPDGVGRYATSVDLSLEADDQLADQAYWRLHLGTVDEARYPRLSVNLRATGLTDDQAEALLVADVGDRIDLTGLPSGLPPEDVGLLVQGYTETLGLMRHEITFNLAPASPWEVGVVGELSHDRLDTAGSELAADASSAATELSVATTDGPAWTPYHADLPFDVMVAGERCTVVSVGGLLNSASNPFIDGDVSGYVANNGTVAFSTAVDRPDVAPAGGTALFTPDGASATGGIGNALTPVGSVTPGMDYAVSSWVYSPGGWSNHRVHVNWHDSSGTYLSSTFGPATDVPAATWTNLQATLTAPASASQASAWASQGGSPSATDEWHAWGVRLVAPSNPGGLGFKVADAFGRSEAAGWGTADTGQAWTTSGGDAADYTTDGSVGSIAVDTLNSARYSPVAQPHTDADIRADLRCPTTPTGGATNGYVFARYTDDSGTTSWYAATAGFDETGTIFLALEKQVAGSFSFLVASTDTGIAFDTSTWYTLRLQVVGTTIRAKVWERGTAEPDWSMSTTDSDLTSGTHVGCRAYVESASTVTLPVSVEFDSVFASVLQTLTVTRSVNGVTKAQSQGAGVLVAEPVVVPL